MLQNKLVYESQNSEPQPLPCETCNNAIRYVRPHNVIQVTRQCSVHLLIPKLKKHFQTVVYSSHIRIFDNFLDIILRFHN